MSTRLVALIVIIGVAPPVYGQRADLRPESAVPLLGHWRLNLARTRYGAGADVRRRETLTCDNIRSRLRCVIRSVRQDGRALVGEFSAALDGSPAPVTGIPDVDAVELTQPTPSLLDATFLVRGSPVFAYRAYRSSDGASLVIVSVDPTSRAALTTVVVYDRMKDRRAVPPNLRYTAPLPRMPIPTHEDAMLPVLNELAVGDHQHRRVLADKMADHFRLTPDERSQMLPSGKAPVIRSRTGWALSYMKQAGLVSSPRRGWYHITPVGRDVLSRRPDRIDNDFLMRFDAFRDFRARSRSEDAGSDDTNVEAVVAATPTQTLVDTVEPPDEALERAYRRLRAAVEAELIDTVKGVSPTFFEELVIDLLVKMGYGGNRSEAARAIGRTGDGGIDGVIDEDRLGLDSIYVQAKRWDASVGRPEIQKFAGALQGQRATKGIFITSSSFTSEAIEYASRIGTRIVLVDGRRLAELMFEHDVGVSPRRAYTVKDVDGDYVEES